eukprot:TRINITY_DN8833_c0_g1_i1.p2 TRINITY_DN8833_c0_g1~~TRINITY_DN8833_c0_g1_i1.p2  ORF type:complete len:110 (-),score=22.76 TRINITY_DN8833_c0_g1_i1:858-1187(-)
MMLQQAMGLKSSALNGLLDFGIRMIVVEFKLFGIFLFLKNALAAVHTSCPTISHAELKNFAEKPSRPVDLSFPIEKISFLMSSEETGLHKSIHCWPEITRPAAKMVGSI